MIRTRRVPFFKSRPSRPLLIATLGCAALGVAIPYIDPLADLFGFQALPLSFLAVLAVMIVTYLALAQTRRRALLQTTRRPPARPRTRPPRATHHPHSLTLASLATQIHTTTAHAGIDQLTGARRGGRSSVVNLDAPTPG